MKKTYKTIADFYNDVKSGKINESEIQVVLDNDMTTFMVCEKEIHVKEASGYDDIEPLYKLLFPKARVDWC